MENSNESVLESYERRKFQYEFDKGVHLDWTRTIDGICKGS